MADTRIGDGDTAGTRLFHRYVQIADPSADPTVERVEPAVSTIAVKWHLTYMRFTAIGVE